MKKYTIKKIIFLPLFLFLLIGTIYAFSTPNSRGINRSVGVQFGTKMGCLGTGLCILVPPNEFNGGTFDAMGQIVVSRGGKTILKIDKNSISVAKAEEQFGNSLFEIKEDFELMPISSNTAQRGNRSVKIKKGFFPISEDEKNFTISF